MPHPSLFRLVSSLLLSVSVTVSGAYAQSTTTEENTNDAKAVSAGLSQTTVLARVGEIEITLGEVIAFRQTLPDQFQQLPDEVLLESILTQMIDQTLLENAARESGLDSKAAYQLALRNQRRAVMADAFMSAEVLANVTEDRIAEAYETQVANAPAVPEVRSAHILVEDKALAEDLKAKLDAGADFATLAAEHSTDATASRGGDRGWLPFDRMVPDYAEAVRNMVEGELAGPVQTPFGWHLIRVDGKRDRPVPPLELVEGVTGVTVTTANGIELLMENTESNPTRWINPGGIPDFATLIDAIDGTWTVEVFGDSPSTSTFAIDASSLTDGDFYATPGNVVPENGEASVPANHVMYWDDPTGPETADAVAVWLDGPIDTQENASVFGTMSITDTSWNPPLDMDPGVNQFRVLYGNFAGDLVGSMSVTSGAIEWSHHPVVPDGYPDTGPLVVYGSMTRVQFTAVPVCPGDATGDGSVGLNDLLAVIGSWGTDGAGGGETNGDGFVGLADLLEVIGNWGNSC